MYISKANILASAVNDLIWRMVFSSEQCWRKVRDVNDTTEMGSNSENKMESPQYNLRGDLNPTVSMQTSYSKKGGKKEDGVVYRKFEKKSVRFALVATAILIPSRKVYSELNLKDSLWWSGEDYTSFRLSAKADLQELREQNKQI
mmetsp:Transcript_20161/g.20263  ORF Transcript_20161/g.20263 Transcript_20161/m.20263 type:complete len:145 (-) Transcript_20161:358-792(-)